MSIIADETLIAAAQRIAPLVRAHAGEAERERFLSKPALNALLDAGLPRMFSPASLGGLEVDPLTCAHVVEEIAAADSAAAWALLNPLVWAHLCCRLPDEGAEEIFGSGPNVVIAGPLHPPMQATIADGGYRVSGRAPFASNCRDATWMAVLAVVTEGETPSLNAGGTPEVRAMFFPSKDCQILDTWHVLGMRGTGSDDIAVHDVFVPRKRTFAVTPEFTPGIHFQGPLYRIGEMAVVTATFAPIVLAIARLAIDEVSALAKQKTPFGSATVLRARATAQAALGRAEGMLRAARALVYETLRATWDRALAGEWPSLTQRADALLATATATSSAAQVVELMYNVAGTTGIYTRSPLERYVRDMLVLKQYGFASENRYETVGQVYLGLPPEFVAIVL